MRWGRADINIFYIFCWNKKGYQEIEKAKNVVFE